MENYKEAWAIELYDAKVIIRSYTYDASGFHEYEFPGYQIDGWDVARWAEIFGIELRPFHVHDNKYSKPEGAEIHLHQRVCNYGANMDDVKDITIYARVLGAHLVEIRVENQWPDEVVTREFTYSGSFSIEWARTD